MEDQLTITFENGEELLCHVILTYSDEESGINYVIFEMPDGEVSAARYNENGEGFGELFDIESDDEWELINDVLEDYYDSLEDDGDTE